VARVALVALVCGCGRFGFEALPAGDAAIGDGSADAAACSTIQSNDWLATPMPLDANKAYQISSDGLTTLDTVTGLRWERNVAPGTFTPLQALSHCASLTLAGCSHWRLPERVELASIVDHRSVSPTINPTAFPNTPIDTDFWTGTPQTSANNFWEINFDNGNASWNGNTFTYHVRCVHSETTGTPPPARYTMQGNSVLDNQTGLTWAPILDPSMETLANAQTYCASIVPGGWRIPESQELQTVVDSTRFSPAIDTTAFPSINSVTVWSASHYIPSVSMVMDLTDGSIVNAMDTSTFSVWCVR